MTTLPPQAGPHLLQCASWRKHVGSLLGHSHSVLLLQSSALLPSGSCVGMQSSTYVLQVPVLIAVDDYNLLHSHTEFYEAASTFHRRQIPPEEIQLAAALRVLSIGEAPKRCACIVVHRTDCFVATCSWSLETCWLHGCRGLFIGAATTGGHVSPKLQPPVEGDWRMECPGFSHQEAMAYANYHIIQVGMQQPLLHSFSCCSTCSWVTVHDAKPAGASGLELAPCQPV